MVNRIGYQLTWIAWEINVVCIRFKASHTSCCNHLQRSAAKSSLAAPHSFLAQQVSLPFLSLQTYNSRPSPLTGLVLFSLFSSSSPSPIECFVSISFLKNPPPLLPFFLRFSSFLIEISYTAEFIHRSLLRKSIPSFSLLYFFYSSQLICLTNKPSFSLLRYFAGAIITSLVYLPELYIVPSFPELLLYDTIYAYIYP